MEVLTQYTENSRIAFLQSLANELANVAADALEPHAGAPIGTDLRSKLAADVHQALRANMPTLVNVRHAMDLIPATA